MVDILLFIIYTLIGLISLSLGAFALMNKTQESREGPAWFGF